VYQQYTIRAARQFVTRITKKYVCQEIFLIEDEDKEGKANNYVFLTLNLSKVS